MYERPQILLGGSIESIYRAERVLHFFKKLQKHAKTIILGDFPNFRRSTAMVSESINPPNRISLDPYWYSSRNRVEPSYKSSRLLHFVAENRNFDDFQVISAPPEAHLLKELQREYQNRRYGRDRSDFSPEMSSIMNINHTVTSLRPENPIWACRFFEIVA